MTKISVIIPVYNTANYLDMCLDSVIAQTFVDLEILCINDGSTDNSASILEAYSKYDKRIKVITQENKGLSGARNTGLDIAKGEYIAFVDSDDRISPFMLQHLYSTLTKSGSDFCFCELYGEDDKNGTFYKWQIAPDYEFRRFIKEKTFNEADSSSEVYFNLPMMAYNKLYKKKLP